MGFLCDEDDAPDKQRKEFFKISLDQAVVDDARKLGISAAPSSTQEARQLLTDFLRKVYAHVKLTVEGQIGLSPPPPPPPQNNTLAATAGWTNLAVVFLFSVPHHLAAHHPARR